MEIIKNLKIIRFLPVLLFVVYVIGRAGEHVKMLNIIPSLYSRTPDSNIFTPTLKFLAKNITYFVDVVYNFLSHPVKNSDTNRRITRTIITMTDTETTE